MPTVPATLAERLDSISFLIARQTVPGLVTEELVLGLWQRFSEKAVGLVAGILARLPRPVVRQHLVNLVVGTTSGITLTADHARLLAAFDQDGSDLKKMIEQNLAPDVQTLLLKQRGPSSNSVVAELREPKVPEPAQRRLFGETLQSGTLEERLVVITTLNALPKIPEELVVRVVNFLKTRPVVGKHDRGAGIGSCRYKSFKASGRA